MQGGSQRYWKIGLTALFGILTHWFYAQGGSGIAETLRQLHTVKTDSVRIDLYNELSWPLYSYNQPDSAIYYSQLAIALSEKTGDIKRLSIAHRRMGIAYINKGDFKKSIYHQEQSLAYSEQLAFDEGIRKALNNLGVIYLNNELYNKALNYFLRSLKYAEAAKDTVTMASLYNNCGLIYLRLSEVKLARNYFRMSADLAKYSLNSDQIIDIKMNVASAYRNLNLLDSAEIYIREVEEILNSASNKKAKYAYWIGKGLVYSERKQHRQAMTCFDSSAIYALSPIDVIIARTNVAEEHLRLNEIQSAINEFELAFKMSEENKAYNNLTYISRKLLQLYSEAGNMSKTRYFVNAHLVYRDSNDKYVKAQQIRQQQLEFDYERKQVADSLKFAQREELKNLELEIAEGKLNREKTFRFALILLLGSVVLLTVFLYNRFFITRRQNRIIARQKLIVEEKNREMLDSIHYAQRLQSAILPPLDEIRQHLKGELLYLPKDIIGGDFYFFEKHNGLLYFAVCDCTGHGIPGAIMSVVCHQALHKAIFEFGKIKSQEILDKARELVIAQLHASEQNIKDGMDCSLLVIDPSSGNYSWAGANNPLWIWDEDGFRELKADKQPVAWYEMAKPFTEQSGVFRKNTRLCLFSDGYPDQFGGEKGKKYKQKQLKSFIEQNLSMNNNELLLQLQKNFFNWKGQLDQVDDVALAVLQF